MRDPIRLPSPAAALFRCFKLPAANACLTGLVLSLPAAALAAAPSLTIYNQNFAVVRDTVALDLKKGTNQVTFTGATACLEPSSVVLRDAAAKQDFRVLEQNYRADPVSQESLLTLNEGKTIQFESVVQDNGQTRRELIRGKIIRAGGIVRPPSMADYGYPYRYGYGSQASATQPVIEVEGKLRFSLPGQPIFPGLADNTILKPTLLWVIESAEPARFDAEVSYVTSDLSWEADYNLVLPEQGNTLGLVGWVTMNNDCGRSFEHARIKLMAGEVKKVRPQLPGMGGYGGGATPESPAPVSEKSFDEYHLYTLEHPTTLLDREKKQVEFVHAEGVESKVLYIYDGATADPEVAVVYVERPQEDPRYGTDCNNRVWAWREFTNSTANHLGMPLPKGRVRIYRQNSDRQLEFVGENTIRHTPKDEVLRLYTGNAFDVVGERKQVAFKRTPGSEPMTQSIDPTTGLPITGAQVKIDPTTGLPIAGAQVNPAVHSPWVVEESYEIHLRNHKSQPIEVRVVEHLCRWENWELIVQSDPHLKTDSRTVEFRVSVKPDEERKVTYTVRYWWY